MLSRSSGVERRSVSARVSQCHGWGSMHSRVHNLATRSMQQRCIPHTFAIGFSRVWPAHRRRKTRCERGRAFLPSHYLLLALSLPLSTFPSLFLLSPQSATRRTIRPLRVYPLSLSYTCNLTFPSFYSASRPVIVDTTVQNGCFTPPLARELGNKLAAGLISLSRLDTATLPLETSRDRCPKPSNRCLDTVSTVSRRSQDQWLFSFSFLQVVRLARYHVISSTDRRTGLR